MITRNEFKIALNQIETSQLILKIQQKGFRNIYNKRWVNNIYLDDFYFSSFKDNYSGISDRVKTRIRWYNDDSSIVFVEFKIKSNDVNFKKTHEIRGLNPFKKVHLEQYVSQVKNKLEDENPSLFHEYKLSNLTPCLLNRYHREYFYNSENNIRVTIDKDLSFYSSKTKIEAHEPLCVIEFKFDNINDMKKTKIELKPFTRYSKYVKGVSITNNFNITY